MSPRCSNASSQFDIGHQPTSTSTALTLFGFGGALAG
jgi:hypothetical protein